MLKSVYIASTGPASGKSIFVFGLMDHLLGRLTRVGYFQPVASATNGHSDTLGLIATHWKQTVADRAVAAYTLEEAETIMAEQGVQALHKGILQAYTELEKRCDFVLCGGTDFVGSTPAFEFEFNLNIARNIGAPLIPVVNGRRESPRHVIEKVKVLQERMAAAKSPVLSTVVSRVGADAAQEVGALARSELSSETPVFVIPEEPSLARPTIQDIAEATGARRIEIEDSTLAREVHDIKVAAMGLPNFLSYITEGELVITPGDRADILAGCLLAHRSANFPNLAGIMLTGGLLPDERVYRLLTGSEAVSLPILAMQEDTYTTVRRIEPIRGWLSPDNPRKLAAAVNLFQSSVDMAVLTEQFEHLEAAAVTPLMFEQQLLSRAAADRKRIVLPEGEDDRILQAAAILLSRGVADIILLGDETTVRRRAAELGLDLSAAEFVDPRSAPAHDRYAATYFDLRRHKGIAPEAAADRMSDASYFGSMMVHLGEADGMVSGAVSTTAHTLRPSFEFIKTKPGISLISSVFLMCLQDRVLVYGDCAVNPSPSASDLADIAISAAGTAAMFGIDPRIAMLSYSSGNSGKGEEVERVRAATELVRERRPDLPVEGPIQYDAAADMGVARTKMPQSAVAGRATVFVFPDLNAGNNAYKAVQRTANAVAIGPVLQGLKRPVNDLSRGCTVADIVNTVAITAIQAQEQ